MNFMCMHYILTSQKVYVLPSPEIIIFLKSSYQMCYMQQFSKLVYKYIIFLLIIYL